MNNNKFLSLSQQKRIKIQREWNIKELLETLENEDLKEIDAFLKGLNYEEIIDIYEIGKKNGAIAQYEALKKLQKQKKDL